MLTLIIGFEKNGKSFYAESLAVKITNGKLYYIATFIPVGDGETGMSRVLRHREHREGKGFETIEKPHSLKDLNLEATATVLLEDVTNLLANYMFCEDADGGVDDVLSDVDYLCESCEHVIAVSFSGMEQGDGYDDATNGYIAAHEEMNRLLFERADAVVRLHDRKPQILKGENFAFL